MPNMPKSFAPLTDRQPSVLSVIRRSIELVQKAAHLIETKKLLSANLVNVSMAASMSASIAMALLLDPQALQALLDRLQAELSSSDLEPEMLVQAQAIHDELLGHAEGVRLAQAGMLDQAIEMVMGRQH